MKVIKARLENYNDRKDGTVSLKLDSLLEVPDSDIAGNIVTGKQIGRAHV